MSLYIRIKEYMTSSILEFIAKSVCMCVCVNSFAYMYVCTCMQIFASRYSSMHPYQLSFLLTKNS